jgi:hypothetical protein
MRPEAVRQPFDPTGDAQDREAWFGARRQRPAHLRGTGQDLFNRARTRQQGHLACQAVHADRVQTQGSSDRPHGLPAPRLTLIPRRSVPTAGSAPYERAAVLSRSAP